MNPELNPELTKGDPAMGRVLAGDESVGDKGAETYSLWTMGDNSVVTPGNPPHKLSAPDFFHRLSTAVDRV